MHLIQMEINAKRDNLISVLFLQQNMDNFIYGEPQIAK